jgi:hypothetical protein
VDRQHAVRHKSLRAAGTRVIRIHGDLRLGELPRYSYHVLIMAVNKNHGPFGQIILVYGARSAGRGHALTSCDVGGSAQNLELAGGQRFAQRLALDPVGDGDAVAVHVG